MTMVNEGAWLAGLREAADGDGEQIRMTHGRVGSIAWQLVDGGASATGRRLLVVELDEVAEARVLDALEVLAGRDGS